MIYPLVVLLLIKWSEGFKMFFARSSQDSFQSLVWIPPRPAYFVMAILASLSLIWSSLISVLYTVHLSRIIVILLESSTVKKNPKNKQTKYIYNILSFFLNHTFYHLSEHLNLWMLFRKMPVDFLQCFNSQNILLCFLLRSQIYLWSSQFWVRFFFLIQP